MPQAATSELDQAYDDINTALVKSMNVLMSVGRSFEFDESVYAKLDLLRHAAIKEPHDNS